MGQSDTKPLEFEIASVKPAGPDVRTANVVPGAGESLTITNVPLRKIIMYAYDIRDFQLAGGPGWIDEKYDIVAKAAATDGASLEKSAETDDQRHDRVARVRERLRSLPALRFGLQAHVEQRERLVLTLRIAKGGPKLAGNGSIWKSQHGRRAHPGLRRSHFHACDAAFNCYGRSGGGRHRVAREI